MKVTIKKYGRWNEDCNWQLESRKEKDIEENAFEEFKEYGGFTYNKKYNEFHSISEDKLRKTVVTVVE